jgi:hypothetical protein
MKKVEGWHYNLRRYIETSAATPFKTGTHDCALFWAGGVEAMTGIDPAADYRGKYTTFRDGKQLIGGDLGDYAKRFFEEVPPAMAQVGDLAMVKGACGIVQGEHIYMLGRGGIMTVPLTRATRAFRVT